MSWVSRMGVVALVALVALSGTGGWLLHGFMQPAPDTAPTAVATAPAVEPPLPSLLAFPAAAPDPQAQAEGDRVELHADGSASIQVRHLPPAWVLAELCRQGASGLAGCGRAATTAAAAPAVTMAPTPVLSRLQNANEQERLDALARAREAGQRLPDETLQGLMASDPSESVRMEAFDSYMEGRSGSLEEIRAALQAALRLPDPALQARAREQLDELEDADRHDGVVPQ